MLRYFTTLKSDEIDSLAIGGFDGMHLGHKALINKLTTSGVILSIDKGSSNLTPNCDRAEYIKNGFVSLKLDSIKNLTSKEFIQLLRDEFKNLKRLVVGYDFFYGRDRSGNITSLKDEFDGEVVVVKEIKVDGVSVHSGVIREYLKKAEIEKANALLGRKYILEASTIQGQGLGSKELVATINLDIVDYILPQEGVYATRTYVEDRWYESITFIGVRSSTDSKYAVETHLIDESIDFLPSIVKVEFISYIRENRKFDSLFELKKQIKEDIQKVKNDSK